MSRAQFAKNKVTVPVQCLLKLLKKMPVVSATFFKNAPEVQN